jgi:hypothetical protein
LPEATTGTAKPVIAKIERVPLRKVWVHEAHDLTRWLEGNPDVLNDVLGAKRLAIERFDGEPVGDTEVMPFSSSLFRRRVVRATFRPDRIVA